MDYTTLVKLTANRPIVARPAVLFFRSPAVSLNEAGKRISRTTRHAERPRPSPPPSSPLDYRRPDRDYGRRTTSNHETLPGAERLAHCLRWWPVAIIMVGLGKVWEAFQRRDAPGHPHWRELFRDAFCRARSCDPVLCRYVARKKGAASFTIHRRSSWAAQKKCRRRSKCLRAGSRLRVAVKLLDANFHYLKSDGEPVLAYEVKDGPGHLDLSQPNDSHIRMLNSHNALGPAICRRRAAESRASQWAPAKATSTFAVLTCVT